MTERIYPGTINPHSNKSIASTILDGGDRPRSRVAAGDMPDQPIINNSATVLGRWWSVAVTRDATANIRILPKRNVTIWNDWDETSMHAQVPPIPKQYNRSSTTTTTTATATFTFLPSPHHRHNDDSGPSAGATITYFIATAASGTDADVDLHCRHVNNNSHNIIKHAVLNDNNNHHGRNHLHCHTSGQIHLHDHNDDKNKLDVSPRPSLPPSSYHHHHQRYRRTTNPPLHSDNDAL
ncbi:hypothetical protein BDB00DRAFT_879474 [Zychaea mexicana]|uniref:uncharacterized protein n=1 Tax=Zychaea mexicana TaxID=64656 RepID=UPI0022FDF342|nr:uncharacterized protein BDB00DRAFT_879474 [Zychaea mexicana]KAI9477104.1 hypothetical protein BDB00DRAFT_879474 [Zychaea mexicana]